MRCRFYLDEDIDVALGRALINRGVDAVTTLEADQMGNTDEEQFTFAMNENRTLISHNIRDFVMLHKKLIDDGRKHSGIIVSDQLPIGTLLKRIMNLWFTLDANDIENRIEFLSSWK